MKSILPKDRGFSLLELIVVLSLGTIVTCISIPELNKIIEIHSLKGAASDFILYLNQNVVRSRKENRKIILDIEENEAIVRDSNTREKISRYSLREKNNFIPREQSLYFSPSGAVTPGRILLYRKDSICEVIISLRGRIRRECH